MSRREGEGASALPERDPLADLVSRSVGRRVESVTAEVLPAGAGIERKRLRYATSAGEETAVFERRQPGDTLEANLLPFLARKTPHVPRVYARGLPPPHAALGPWLLLEDVFAAPLERDHAAVVRAKREIEEAVANDIPALRALGLTQRGTSESIGLVHGALATDVAYRTDRGVVIVDWANAYLGYAGVDR